MSWSADCRISSMSARLIEPGTLNILSINVWQSVTIGLLTISLNRSARPIISSVKRISFFLLIIKVKLTRNKI